MSTQLNGDLTVVQKEFSYGRLYCYGKIALLCVATTDNPAFPASGVQLPVTPISQVTFVGKANNGKSDVWYQGFKVDYEGLLTARSIDNNSSVSVTWCAAYTTFLIK